MHDLNPDHRPAPAVAAATRVRLHRLLAARCYNPGSAMTRSTCRLSVASRASSACSIPTWVYRTVDARSSNRNDGSPRPRRHGPKCVWLQTSLSLPAAWPTGSAPKVDCKCASVPSSASSARSMTFTPRGASSACSATIALSASSDAEHVLDQSASTAGAPSSSVDPSVPASVRGYANAGARDPSAGSVALAPSIPPEHATAVRRETTGTPMLCRIFPRREWSSARKSVTVPCECSLKA